MSKKLTEREALEALEANPVPEDVKIRNNSFILEAVIDPTPQPLLKLRPYHKMALDIPALLSDEAKIVLHLLFECFDKAGFVAEGMIGDLMWGFQQVTPPTHPSLTLKGIFDLEAAGYIKFQAKDGAIIDKHSDKLESAWIRYTEKLKNLVYTPGIYVLKS